MKNAILLIIGLYTLIHKVDCQNLSIVYEAYTVQNDVALKALPELSNYRVKYHYTLTIDKGRSKFSRDSVLVESFPNTDMNEIWYFENIYKNYNQDSWIKHSGRYKDGYGIEKKISQMVESNNFQWRINQLEKRVIAGVECIKATSMKGYTVWFAPKLPYPDGPRYGVYNLPGLVLELETEQDRWVAKSIVLNNDKVVVPNLELVKRDQEIQLSWNEINNLESEKVIILDKNTPLRRWLKFKNLQKK